MNHYEYATKKIKKPYKHKIISLLNMVRKDLKGKLTFQHKFVGSEALGLVTYDPSTNTGFDFDIDILPTNKIKKYSPKELKTMLINSFNKFCKDFNFSSPENSSSVFTIKVKDKNKSKIIFSADFAIVDVFLDKKGNCSQKKVYFDKTKKDSYYWQKQPQEIYDYLKKIKLIKDKRLRNQVRILYLDKKNKNTDINKSSSSLRIETVFEVYSKYFKG